MCVKIISIFLFVGYKYAWLKIYNLIQGKPLISKPSDCLELIIIFDPPSGKINKNMGNKI
jgi:hypothetical protein